MTHSKAIAFRIPGAEVSVAGQRLGLDPLFGADAAPDGGKAAARAREAETEAAEEQRRLNALLERGTLEGLAVNDNGAGSGDELLANRRLELRFGYGVGTLGERFTATPEVGLGMSQAHRDYTLGWRLARDRREGDIGSMELTLEARRRETANDNATPGHDIGRRFTSRG